MVKKNNKFYEFMTDYVNKVIHDNKVERMLVSRS